MQQRSYSARHIIVTEKPGRISDFSSIQSCGAQSEQNETDEPPSLFKPLEAGTGLYRQHGANTRPFSFFNYGTLFIPKTEITEICEFFFADLPVKEKREPLSCGLPRLIRGDDSGEMMQNWGFILRDRSGRIKTIISGNKRST